MDVSFSVVLLVFPASHVPLCVTVPTFILNICFKLLLLLVWTKLNFIWNFRIAFVFTVNRSFYSFICNTEELKFLKIFILNGDRSHTVELR